VSGEIRNYSILVGNLLGTNVIGLHTHAFEKRLLKGATPLAQESREMIFGPIRARLSFSARIFHQKSQNSYFIASMALEAPF